MHVKTDVFCSGAVILPDRFARIFNVGGYSGESSFGLRLYAPDGSAGVNGTNDWEEDPGNFTLQVGVAGSESSPPATLQVLFSKIPYTGSALVILMSNGSVLVIGGENGPNGAPSPSLEVLPTILGGPTTVSRLA